MTNTINVDFDAKKFSTALRTIKSTGAKLDELIQSAGLMALTHAREHHDASKLNQLFAVMPAGSRKLALSQWAQAFGEIRPNSDKETKADNPFKWARGLETNISGAVSRPWYSFKREPHPADEFDILSAVISQLKRAQQFKDDGKVVKNEHLIARLGKLVNYAAPEIAATDE